LLDGVVERGVGARVPTPGPGGDLDVLDELGEELAALGVDRRLLVLRGCPLGVAGHVGLLGLLGLGLSAVHPSRPPEVLPPSPWRRSTRAPGDRPSPRGGSSWRAGRRSARRRGGPPPSPSPRRGPAPGAPSPPPRGRG